MDVSTRVLVSMMLCMVIVAMLDSLEEKHCLSDCYGGCNIDYKVYNQNYIRWTTCALECTMGCVGSNIDFDLDIAPSSSSFNATKEALKLLSKAYIPKQDGLPEEIVEEIEIIKNENPIPPNITKGH